MTCAGGDGCYSYSHFNMPQPREEARRGLFKGKLKLMRQFYSWDEVPIDFFVDRHVRIRNVVPETSPAEQEPGVVEHKRCVRMYVCTYVVCMTWAGCMYVCVYVGMYVCVYVRMTWTGCIYVTMHVFINIYICVIVYMWQEGPQIV
jgi:hypothetical protein